MNSSASVTSYAVERRGHLSRASVTTPTVEALGSISVAVTSDMREVEEVWRDLSDTVESPGQSYDFIRLWVDTRGIPAGRVPGRGVTEMVKPLASAPL